MKIDNVLAFFFSICTINDKICNLIIDNDSYEIVMLVEVVKKFQLKIEKHPRFYMDELCIVLFSIGTRYFDSVWYDMVFKDTCHL